MNLINLTPHEINIFRADGTTLTVPPSGSVARRAETREVAQVVDGVTFTRTVFGAIDGLPDPQPDAIYITSAILASAAMRHDVVSPGEAVRDDAGRIIGTKSLATYV